MYKRTETFLDIDDDIYAYEYVNESEILLWEIYKIDPKSEQIMVLPHGKWTVNNGLEISSENKWKRR